MKDFTKFHADKEIAKYLISEFDNSKEEEIFLATKKIITECRKNKSGRTLLDKFLSEYGLTNDEGVALMCLAESVLRIPDDSTKDELISEKITNSNWVNHINQADSLFVNAATWGLLIAGKVIQPPRALFDNPLEWIGKLTQKTGETSVRQAIMTAMQILSKEFVMGNDFDSVIKSSNLKKSIHSFDMLGEAARTKSQAESFYNSYVEAIERVANLNREFGINHGVSIKLSALHPRYETLKYELTKKEILNSILSLVNLAYQNDVEITIDAEEQHRLSISQDLIEEVAMSKKLKDWNGLGFAIQAYGKRASNVVNWANELCSKREKMHVRLTKGAYWDGEIKFSQAGGHEGFPVLINKSLTDLNYLFIASKLLHSDNLMPKFATHNAHSVASIYFMAEEKEYEFQRLFGMGELLYKSADKVLGGIPSAGIYAPIGPYRDLLPYLVRRLLENGANSSFVNNLLNPEVSPDDLAENPVKSVKKAIDKLQHEKIVNPSDIFSPRVNSSGYDLSEPENLLTLKSNLLKFDNLKVEAKNFCSEVDESKNEKRYSIANGNEIGGCSFADIANELSFQQCTEWKNTPVSERADIFYRIADNLEKDSTKFLYYLIHEAGKTYKDSYDEIREAVDFLRYYADNAKALLSEPNNLNGPTGESNQLFYQSKGTFVCISPWNFPLAIFAGQIAAALVTGNSVISKPSEHTPIIATMMIELFYENGVPKSALKLIQGDGSIGSKLISFDHISGVAFTGSSPTAKKINLQLAKKNGPISSLIAETGGLNAMFIDSSSLHEQVVDDIMRSSFNSAGQRCSALRLAIIHESIFDDLVEMIKDAMAELTVGNPEDFHCDVGPIIDEGSRNMLLEYISECSNNGYQVFSHNQAPDGNFVSPTLIELNSIDEINEEKFGPILHVVKYKTDELEQILTALKNKQYGLTMGVHSRIESKADDIINKSIAGNTYINRDIVGAVVGSQPFGGTGLSGTGFKAGGPNYLLQFVDERSITKNTVAFGGNAEILNLED